MPTSRYCWGHPVLRDLGSQVSCLGFKGKEAGSLRKGPAPVAKEPFLAKEMQYAYPQELEPLPWAVSLHSFPLRFSPTTHCIVDFLSPNFKSKFAPWWLLQIFWRI